MVAIMVVNMPPVGGLGWGGENGGGRQNGQDDGRRSHRSVLDFEHPRRARVHAAREHGPRVRTCIAQAARRPRPTRVGTSSRRRGSSETC